MNARNWLVVATALLALGTTTTRGAAQKAATTGPSDDVSALPLHLVAAKGSPTTLALLLSGDGSRSIDVHDLIVHFQIQHLGHEVRTDSLNLMWTELA